MIGERPRRVVGRLAKIATVAWDAGPDRAGGAGGASCADL